MMCEDGETVFEFYWNMNDNMAAVRIWLKFYDDKCEWNDKLILWNLW
jgi:hypothetical protein